MILCNWKQLAEAHQLVAKGYQVLYLNPIKHTVGESKQWGHLLDIKEDRLIETALRLGIKNPKVRSKGTIEQRVVLTGSSLRKAIVESDQSLKTWFNQNGVLTA